MAFCLLSCALNPFWKRIYTKRKEFAPLGSTFFPLSVDPFSLSVDPFPLSVDPFSEEDKNDFNIASLEIYNFSLNMVSYHRFEWHEISQNSTATKTEWPNEEKRTLKSRTEIRYRGSCKSYLFTPRSSLTHCGLRDKLRIDPSTLWWNIDVDWTIKLEQKYPLAEIRTFLWNQTTNESGQAPAIYKSVKDGASLNLRPDPA